MRTSTVRFENLAALERVFAKRASGERAISYGRSGMDTHRALEEVFMQLEGGTYCVLAPSGMAAINIAFLGILKSGDHVLVCDGVYGPVKNLDRALLKGLGISVTYFSAQDDLDALITPNTKMIYVESPGSLLFEMLDLPAAALQGSRANPSYAFGFWNNRGAGSLRARETDIETLLGREWPLQSWSRVCLCKDAPASLIACIGSKGQRIYVWPEKKLIIVRMGKGDGFRDAEFLKRVRWEASKD